MNARRVSTAAEVIHGARKQGRVLPVGEAVALDAAGMLHTPETAAELVQLRIFAGATERRHDEIRSCLAQVDLLRDGAGIWDLGMAVLAILDGPAPQPEHASGADAAPARSHPEPLASAEVQHGGWSL